MRGIDVVAVGITRYCDEPRPTMSIAVIDAPRQVNPSRSTNRGAALGQLCAPVRTKFS